LKKILIIRFSSIGDIVLTTPVIRCLKEQLPDAEIHFLTKKRFEPVVSANPGLAKIFVLENKLGALLPELQREKYDFVVDLHRNIRSIRVRLALRRPSGTFSKLNFRKWLMVNFKINRLPDKHIVDRYFGAVAGLGISNDMQGLDYFIPGEDELQRRDLPVTHRNGFIALVIGGRHYTKMLPDEKVMYLCEKINMPVVLLGGPEDRAKAERIVMQCERPVYNACGLYNINQSASVIKMASAVVTNDTGLMHIAAAFRKEVFSLWGNTIPAFGMYPYLPGHEEKSHIFEVDGLSCRPCSKLGYARCPRKHFRCMMDQDMDTLLKGING
jgi:ADP-heptose:LPS heptosyltransferase